MAYKRLEVEINDKRFCVVCDDEKSDIKAAAAYVEQMINYVALKNKKLSVNQAQILAALNIADELYKVKREVDELKSSVDSISDDKSLSEQVNDILSELENVRNELDAVRESELEKMAEIVNLKNDYESEMKLHQSVKRENEVLKEEREKLLVKLRELSETLENSN